MNTQHPHPFALAALFLLGACGGDVESSSHSYATIQGGGDTRISFEGLTVEVDPSVEYRYEMHSVTGKTTVKEARINGMLFELESDRFHLGGHVFAGLESGDHILIGAEDILVNGEKRWDMPTD